VRIVLLALDRDSERAEKILRARYPHAEIEILPPAKIDSGSALQRLKVLRALTPDLFAVATEQLAWQQGQNALLTFGALGGAGRVLLFDAHGQEREEVRSGALLRAPFRFLHEALASWTAVNRARRELAKLEHAVETANQKSVQAEGDPDAPTISYLRTTPAAGTQSGGATTHTLGFINAAVELGAHLSLITNDCIAGLDEAKVSMKLIEPDPLGLTRPAFDLRNGLLFTARACAEIARQPPDFIYQRYSRFNWTGVEASLRTRRPLLLEYNGSEVWMARHWGRMRLADLLERCERLNLAAATRIFVVADVERDNLLKAGVAADKIVVNPNGVDVEQFRPGIGGSAVRNELGVGEEETLAGFVGTFGPWHGVLTLAEAITMLPEDCGVRFLLVGAGRFRDEVERLVRNAGKERQVIFTGHVDHERVPAFLDACDILLSPHVPLEDGSEFFGSPTKLFEYMAMGKGIVASRLGQIGDVLADEETALLVEPGNARDLSEAILRLSKSKELREKLGASARGAAVADHTWKHNAKRVLDAYHDFIETV
jgi:glycosyltransferase involved in cell wall biosynthesis